MTTGRDVDPASVGPVPARVRVERFVPQAHVFPLCVAVVAHGGSGTTLGALAHGLPLLLVPQGADQFDNAARCERAGAAIVLRPDELTADAVRARSGAFSTSRRTEALRQAVAAEIAAMPTAAEAVPAIEAYLTPG